MHSNPATNSVGHASISGPVLSCEFSTYQASLADLIPQTPPASQGRKTFLSLKFINHHMTFHMASKPRRSYCRFYVVNPLPCLWELFKNSANPSSKWHWCSWFTARENKQWTELWLHVKMIHLLFVVLASKTGGMNKYIYVAYINVQKREENEKGTFPFSLSFKYSTDKPFWFMSSGSLWAWWRGKYISGLVAAAIGTSSLAALQEI